MVLPSATSERELNFLASESVSTEGKPPRYELKVLGLTQNFPDANLFLLFYIELFPFGSFAGYIP
jgi:hypothetical protein